MPSKPYLNFDLLLNQTENGYQARVTSSPAGQAIQDFALPFSPLEIENLILRIGRNRSNVRSLHLDSMDMPSIKLLGGKLYSCLFSGGVSERFRSSQAIAKHEGKGLRIRLHFGNASKLIDIPWELLFDAANNDYIGLSVNTPIIRSLDLASIPEIQPIQGALRVLVMISSPTDLPPLDVEREWKNINEATQGLQDKGLIVLEKIEPSLGLLQRKLRTEDYHVFHYIGHGGFNQSSNDGVLVLEDGNHKSHLVNGQHLGTILHDEPTLQLAILNSCNGGRTSVADPFAGVGQSLLQKGIPAVIAMQFEITDRAAVAFTHELYSALVDGYSIDAAVAEARKMIFNEINEVEWATPVLYMSVEGGSLVVADNASFVKKPDETPKSKPVEAPLTTVINDKEQEPVLPLKQNLLGSKSQFSSNSVEDKITFSALVVFALLLVTIAWVSYDDILEYLGLEPSAEEIAALDKILQSEKERMEGIYKHIPKIFSKEEVGKLEDKGEEWVSLRNKYCNQKININKDGDGLNVSYSECVSQPVLLPKPGNLDPSQRNAQCKTLIDKLSNADKKIIITCLSFDISKRAAELEVELNKRALELAKASKSNKSVNVMPDVLTKSVNASNIYVCDTLSGADLKIRKGTSQQSDELGVSIPDNEIVEVTRKNIKPDLIRGRRGFWVEVKWKGQTGYVFDGYLKPVK